MKVDHKRTTVLVFVIATVTAFWIIASSWMQSAERFDNWTGILISGGLLTLVGAVMGLSFIFLTRGAWTWFVIVGALGSFLIVYGLKPLFLVGALIAAIMWYWSAFHAARELVERRTIRVGSILVHALPKVLLGIYVLLSFAFYLTPASQNITERDAENALRDQITRSYNSSALATELSKLPPSQRMQVEREVSGQAVQTLSRVLNFQFCLTSNACTPTMLELLPPIYAFLFFLIIWSFGFIFRELGVLLGTAIFTILCRFQVIRVDQEDAKVDVLRI